MRAFIIRPFGVKQGIDFDRVVRDLIDPVLARLGVTGRDTLEILKQGNIRIDMFQRLLTADLILADVSIHNANVFYELGIRHALRDKRTFLLSSAQDAYPFDLQTDRYFRYDKDDPGASASTLLEALRQTLASEDQDSPVFRSLPDLQAQDRSQFLAVPRGFREEVELAAARRQPGDLGLLAAEAEGFEWESEGQRVVGRAQFNLKAYHAARITWEKIRRLDPLDREANSLLGTIYQRLGDLTQSDVALKRILDRKGLEPGARAEVHSLLGRNAKARWKNEWVGAKDEPLQARRENALRSPYLEESYEAYARGFGNDLNHYYSGLNALAMLTIVLELARALPEVWNERFERETEAGSDLEARQAQKEKLAGAVELSLAAAHTRLKYARLQLNETRDLISQDRPEEKTDFWVDISEADLSFLASKRPARVADGYRRALSGVPDFAIGAARDQLRMYESLDILSANVQAALAAIGLVPEGDEQPTPRAATHRTLLFTGHMVDAPGRESPRFPPDKEGLARQAIRKAIEEEQGRPEGVALGIAGAASGGDILFHEVCGDLGIPSRVLLALPKSQFIMESVAPARGDWGERFDRLTASLPVRVLADSKELPSWLAEKRGYSIWQRSNLWMLHNALVEGGENVSLIALWNGKEGDGPGGTGDLVMRARDVGASVIVLNSDSLFGLRAAD
ncbi:MAG TPA: tetratricopeptide repeat-containing protein [Thermoanaerobaculia bacterium]|nr:tetratricopeptide repeat-containing protein [Thermoanaerobaculia bacterium]